MYKLIQQQGDMLMVPQIVLSKLSTTKSEDGRFKVALYALMQGTLDAAKAAGELHMKESDVQRALDFWEGAGLLEKGDVLQAADDSSFAARRRLSTSDVVSVSGKNNGIAKLLDELQRIFGGVLNQNDINIFVTLQESDNIPAELILLAAGHCIGEKKCSARYIEKVLLSWRRDGICTLEQADAYLHLLEKRRKKEKVVAELMGMHTEDLTLKEKKTIAVWFEEYKYNKEMIEAARSVSGENQGKILYLNGVLKKWNAKGYRTPKEVWHSGENRNAPVQGSETSFKGKDILQDVGDYTTLYKRGEA